MANGWRRGGLVHRNGRTFHRRGTAISPGMVTFASIVVIGTLLGGTPLAAHPVLLGGLIIVGLGAGSIWAYNRLGRKPGTVTHWAKGQLKRQTKKQLYKLTRKRRAIPKQKPSQPKAGPGQPNTAPSATGRTVFTGGPRQTSRPHCYYCHRPIGDEPVTTTSGQSTAHWHKHCIATLQRSAP